MPGWSTTPALRCCAKEFLRLGEFRRQLEVNLIGHLAVIQAFLPLLRRGVGEDRQWQLCADDTGDREGLVALLTGDAWVRMPPVPLEYQGRELAAWFFAMVAFRKAAPPLVATRANGQAVSGA